MKSAVLISGRDKATRLPGKLFRPILGRPAIEHLIERVRRATVPDLVVMATSVHQDDQSLVDVAEKMGIHSFQGSEDDKLERYRDAAQRFDADVVAIVDADDILVHDGSIDAVISHLQKNGGDYAVVDGLPLGGTAFGLSRDALERICASKKQRDTEIWGALFADDPAFASVFLEPPEELCHPEIRLTLDYKEDLDVIGQIFEGLAPGDPEFTLFDVVRFLNDRPELKHHNAGAHERYVSNLEKRLREQSQTVN